MANERGINLVDSRKSNIISNGIVQNQQQGLFITRGSELLIKNNNIINNNQKRSNYDGILIVGNASNIKITDNRVHYGHDRAIESSPNSSNLIIIDNNFLNFSGDPYDESPWWSSNRTTGDGRIAVDNYGTNCTIYNNLGYADENEPIIVTTTHDVLIALGDVHALWPFNFFIHPRKPHPQDYGDNERSLKAPYPKDHSGNGHNLKARGGNVLYWKELINFQGKISYYTFDGKTESLFHSDDDHFSFGNGTRDSPFSIIALILHDPTVACPATIIGKYDRFGDGREWVVRVLDGGGLEFELYDETNNARISKTIRNFFSGEWTFLAVTYDGSGRASGIKVYRDAVRVQGEDFEDGRYQAMKNTNSMLRIGCSLGNGRYKYEDHFKGSLSWPAVTGSELTQTEIDLIADRLKAAMVDQTARVHPVLWN